MIVLTYVNDCIIIGTSMKSIDAFIRSMQHGKENFILTDEGDVNKFLGIEIVQHNPNTLELVQPFLINQILHFLGLCHNEFKTDANSCSTPVAHGLLHHNLAGNPRKLQWKYRTAVGMTLYLQNSTCPNISMAVHQTAHFSNQPMLSHKKAIICILADTS